ncbi:MAG TPA: peptide deformylase [Bryobacteraceae bacterium]|nr:peptide deformylase [Bryobacteraceae bacterium]
MDVPSNDPLRICDSSCGFSLRRENERPLSGESRAGRTRNRTDCGFQARLPWETSIRRLSIRLKILQVGDPVLRQKARALSNEEIRGAEIQQLIDFMLETMRDAPGVGLAAPQVGISLQLAIIEDRAEYLRDLRPEILAERKREPIPFHVIINPQIQLKDGAPAAFFEGCLSLAGFSAVVPRAAEVVVDCLDRFGEPKQIQAYGWYARILQHEIDHLNGALYLDRMLPRTFTTMEHLNRYWKDKTIAEVESLLAP